MKPKHTPGPWTANKIPSSEKIAIDDENNNMHVALVYQGDGVEGRHDAIANARLISAAPDLSEAAKNTDEKSTLLFALLAKRGVVFTPEEEKLAQDFYIKNQRAIAKAEGR